MMGRRLVWTIRVGAIVAWASALAGCATNPVTGERQLALISEKQEIEMGREADTDVVESIGLYPNPALQQYLQALGIRVAATTERPHLPWTFRVIDDAAVNAFAIPGGFVYMTRGILAHLNSEAELVAILGHEIGHVTARHSVSQMSKQQLLEGLLVGGMILSPRLARFGNLAEVGLGLMFMKFSRADEAQADQLSLKYMLAAGYDPRKLVDVFAMIRAVSQEEGAGRLPQWMSTHPDPENREAWAARAVAGLNRDLSGLAVNRPAYLQRLEGLVFGENPREGMFEGTLFRHPDLAFRIQFPRGWQVSNEKRAVGALSPRKDAVAVLQLSSAPTAPQAARRFALQQGIETADTSRRQIGGFPAVSLIFRYTTEQDVLAGQVAWIEYEKRVYQILGYTTLAHWTEYSRMFGDTIASFSRETDPRVLNVQPHRLSIVELSRPSTLESLLREYPSTVDPKTVALINHLQGTSTLPSGERFKRVVGGPRGGES